MSYSHRFTAGALPNGDLPNGALPNGYLPNGKVVCVGLNYAAHVAEMGSQAAPEPVLFIKPATALRPFAGEIAIPVDRGECHFETELALLIGAPLRNCDPTQAQAAIAGVGLALDLTLRDLQKKLKQAGHPWERAKGFDGACPVSEFLPPAQVGDLQNLEFRFHQNGVLRQHGHTATMLTPVLELLCYMSRWFTLEPGDIVLTGTPEGVGPLAPGDRLVAELGTRLRVEAGVRAR